MRNVEKPVYLFVILFKELSESGELATMLAEAKVEDLNTRYLRT